MNERSILNELFSASSEYCKTDEIYCVAATLNVLNIDECTSTRIMMILQCC